MDTGGAEADQCILQKYIELSLLPSIFSKVYFSKDVFCKYILSKDNHPSSRWRQSQVGRRRQTTYPRRSLQPCCFGEMVAARCSGLKNIARGLLEVDRKNMRRRRVLQKYKRSPTQIQFSLTDAADALAWK